MIGLVLAALGALTAQSAQQPTIVATCYLRDQRPDPKDSKKFIPEGPSRLLVVAFPKSGSDVAAMAALKLHDPTGILTGQPIRVLQRNEDGGFVLGWAPPGASDNRVLATKSEAADPTQIAYFFRVEGGSIVGLMGGGCAAVVTTAPEEEWRTKTKFRASIEL